jgi:hypothetical protein
MKEIDELDRPWPSSPPPQASSKVLVAGVLVMSLVMFAADLTVMSQSKPSPGTFGPILGPLACLAAAAANVAGWVIAAVCLLLGGCRGGWGSFASVVAWIAFFVTLATLPVVMLDI